MEENVKNQLDQIGNLVDAKIEKAFHNAKDSATGEIESSLKSEINNLTNEYNTKFDAAQKRMDAIETASQKIETTINLKHQEIEKLKEYKSSLINSVVTGKVKVC